MWPNAYAGSPASALCASRRRNCFCSSLSRWSSTFSRGVLPTAASAPGQKTFPTTAASWSTVFSAGGSAYGSIYFTLLAVHHAHVGVGVLLDGWLLTRLRGDLTEYRRGAVMAVALYWYFVSLAGLAVTATILIPAW